MTYFTKIPFEIVSLIVAEIDEFSLRKFSLVNKCCRAASLLNLFYIIKIGFSRTEIKVLEEISRSLLASCMRTVYYVLLELVDPSISSISISLLPD